MRVGIEKIYAYPCTLALDMTALAEARGASPTHPLDELWVDSRSLNPVWEDPVTMAVNAARGLLRGQDPEQVELIIVGSESSVDFGKPMSTWVQRFTNASKHCRNFETKHACYGGTAGLMMAAHWIASGQARGRKALVVCADQSRAHMGKPWEYVLGAASVAMLISDKPDFLEFELDKHGYWTNELSDTYRPTSRDEVGHAETSLMGYLEAVEGACEHFMARVGPIDYDQYFARHIYHVPFGAMTWRGHRAVSRRWQPEYGNKQIHATFEAKSKPGLRYNRRFGGTYTSATFLAMMGTIASAPALTPGERISVFSYGSGSCAEFYSVKVGERAHEVVAGNELDARLDARRSVSVPEYEAIEAGRALQVDNSEFTTDKASPAGHFEQVYAGKQLCMLDGVHGWERDYRLS